MPTEAFATPETPATRGRSRKYTQVMAVIYQAAIEVFASEGLAGASTQAIADRAGLSKAQLHYYIDSKESLYRLVLQDIVDEWIAVFGFSDEGFGPRKVLSDLIRRKMLFSFQHPLRSRIFAAETMRGAPVLRAMMDAQSGRRTHQAAAVIQNWMNQGLMQRADPLLFLFHLWAVTQFYADHAVQVAYYREMPTSDGKDQEYLIGEVTAFLLRGAGVK
jgi:TetR/AcrR family transcriptional regulator